ncbi:lysophospholipid acyltransferase family protein [soil metagenome]
MQAFFFYISYPFIYLIASLPFGALYKVSDFLFHLLWLSGYRKDVVMANLRNSFPEKSEDEIKYLTKKYYRYLCDLILETLKTLRTTEKEARERCLFHNPEWLTKLYEEKRSVILVMGHYGNWEWAGPAFTLNTGFQLNVIYRPLSNTYFDRMMVSMRTKFGTRITPVQQTLRDMVATRNELTAIAFIADQTAHQDKAHWMTFLHQDTAVFTGPEKLGIKFDYPIVYINTQRPKRGYYEVTPELMFLHPKETTEGEISEAFMRRLEKAILVEPTPWLWSHRRWKHRRPALL